MLMRRDGVVEDDGPNAKLFRAKVKAGDAFILRSGGGGGFGSPPERPAEDVQHDVRHVAAPTRPADGAPAFGLVSGRPGF